MLHSSAHVCWGNQLLWGLSSIYIITPALRDTICFAGFCFTQKKPLPELKQILSQNPDSAYPLRKKGKLLTIL
jgi:hypothetical protein